MTRNLKALGLALVAMFAMSGLAASAAQAVSTFNSDGTPTFLTAEAKTSQTFVDGEKEVICEKVGVAATDKIVGTSVTEVTVHPTYSGSPAEPNGAACTAKLSATESVKAFVEFTTCDYKFTAATDANGHAVTHIVCTTPGDAIHIKVTALKLKCYTITEQTLGGGGSGGGVHYDTTGTTPNRDIDVTATNIKVKAHREGACGEGETTATYNGTVTVKGHNEAKANTEIWYTE